jgi:hypothetical protein
MRRESDTLRAGDRAPEFALFDANGRAYSLRELLSERADLEERLLHTEADRPLHTASDRPLETEARRPLQTEAHRSVQGVDRPLQPQGRQLLLVFDRGTW